MILKKIDEILGRRIINVDGCEKFEVIVGIPKPVPNQKDEYYCAYCIIGIGFEGIRYAIGIDAIQSVQLAFFKIGADLHTSEEAKNGQLGWVGEFYEGDTGFPHPDKLANILERD